MWQQPPAPLYSRPKRRLADDELATWRAFLRAHSVVTRGLDQRLADAGALTLSELDVLIQLDAAEQRRLRLSDLAARVLITKSGITRLVDRLSEDGLVERRPCAEDGRVQYAQLTEAGRRALRRSIGTHLRDVAAAFADHIGDAERPLFRAILERIAGRDGTREARAPARQGHSL